jgi:AcrR family transcriptional regulator
MTTDQAPAATRASERGAATRTGLLEAARGVFTSAGYAQAGVTDIVALAGTSVGSLYHHFSGKADLYLTLYDELITYLAEQTRLAVRHARDTGVSDPMQLFLTGARRYLDLCIEDRELAAVFAGGDGPPGFELIWRQRLAEWVARNTEFFARGGEPLEEAVAIVMTGAMTLAVTEVSLAVDAARARRIADSVMQVLSRLENPTSQLS